MNVQAARYVAHQKENKENKENREDKLKNVQCLGGNTLENNRSFRLGGGSSGGVDSHVEWYWGA